MHPDITEEIHKNIDSNKAKEEKAYRKGCEHVLDYPARAVTHIAHLLGFTRASLTYFWVIVQFLSTFLFIKGDYIFNVVGVLIFQFMFIVDLADGKLARYHEKITDRKIKKPLYFKYLDRVGHYVNDSLLFVFLGYGSMSFGVQYLYLGVAAALFFLFSKAININPAWYTSEQEQKDIQQIANKVHIRSDQSFMKQLLFDVLRVEHLFSVLFIGIVVNVPHYTVALYAIVYFLEFVRKLVSQAIRLIKLDKAYQDALDKDK